ncbi:MAG: hypothetical protein KAI81_05245 [Candidatus Marinimicrobia bacterium]|nr:hypothetical protein [Candidatus Neomarinimicrobiota bacterium]
MKLKMIKNTLLLLTLSSGLFAQIDFGSDLVSRYVWRGTDFGNSASVQPFISYSTMGFEMGAWASYPLTNDAIEANENDLYLSYTMGDATLTFTDYYFPEGLNFTDYSDYHILELSASYAFGPLSVLAAYNISGDDDNSYYAELGYDIISTDELGLNAVLGLGNGAYVLDVDPNIVNLALTASKGNYWASYILNPDADTNFLVFGYSLEF